MTEPQTSTTAIAAAAAAAVAASKKQEEEEQGQGQGQGQGQDRPTNNNNPILSFFLNILQLLPLPKKKPEPITSESSQPIVKEESVDEPKPTVVTFPRQVEQELPSLKLEAEDSDTNTNPVLLWQVYAIGGFFILRWAWTRWNERKGKKKPSNEDPPPGHE